MQRVHRVVGAAGTAVVLAVSGGAVDTELRDRPVDAWAAGQPGGDGLFRYVVTAEQTTPEAPAARAAAESSVLPGAPEAAGAAGGLIRTGATRLQRVDVARLTAAQGELGADGRVVVDVAGRLLYERDEQWRVVSTDPAVEGSFRGAPRAVRGAVNPPGAAPADVEPAASLADAALAALDAVDGVDSAQRLSDGRVLVATTLTAEQVARLDGVTSIEQSVTLPVAGAGPDVGPDGGALDVPTAQAPADPLVGQAWFLRNNANPGVDTGAFEAWQATRGQGTVVAIVDTGFDRDHPDLAAGLWVNPTEACGGQDTNGNGKAGDCNGWNFTRNNADIDNGSGGWHGTAVAGAAGARADNSSGAAGIAPDVRLMPLAVGSERGVDVYLAAEAIRYAADNGADVINLSFGGAMSGPIVAYLRQAIAYAGSKDAVVVAAAGNDSANRDSSVVYPANYDEPNMLTVGSSTRSETVAGHSAYGAAKVDLFAPGESILAPTNTGGYQLWNGTSFASPLTAGAVALHASLDPAATPAELVQAVKDGATRHSSYAGRSVSGGRLSVTALDSEAAGVRYAFAGAGRQVEGAVTPAVTMQGRAPEGDLTARLALGMRVDGEIYAVSGVDLGGGAVTDDDGQVVVEVDEARFAEGVSFGLSPELPVGRFVLLAQVLADGEAVTRPSVAPLTIVPAPSPAPEPAPSQPNPSQPSQPGPPQPAPGPTGGSTPAPAPSDGSGGGSGGGSSGGGSGGGSSGGSGGGSGGDGPAPEPAPDPADGRAPGAPAPTDTRGPAPAPAPAPTPAPSDGSGSAPGPAPAPAPGSDPDPGPTDGGAPAPAPGPAPTPGPGSPDPERGYDGSDDFGITRLAPAVVSTSGGELVTIEGSGFPDDVRIRVGSSGLADIWGGDRTSVSFFAPPRVVGSYDVVVSTAGGDLAVLPGALTYVDPAGSPSPAPPDPGSPAPAPGPAPGPGPGDQPPTQPGPGGGGDSAQPPTPSQPGSPAPAQPGGPTPAPPQPVPTRPAPSDPGGAGPQRQIVTGPGGLRLVRGTTTFTGVPATLWDGTGCDSGCSGTQI